MKFALLAASSLLLTPWSHGQGLVMVKPMPPADIIMELKSGLSSADVLQDVRQHRLTRLPTAEELVAIKTAGGAPDLLAVAQSPALVSNQAAPLPTGTPSSLPRYWIFGLIMKNLPSGGVLVSCQSVKPSAQLSPLPRAGDPLVYFAQPPLSARTQRGDFLINCEARLLGKISLPNLEGKTVEMPALELVKNLGVQSRHPSAASTAPPPAAQHLPVSRQATIAQGGWQALDTMGGPQVQMKLLAVDFDSIRLRFSTWPAAKVIPVARGRDAKTVIFDDGQGCTVSYIDSISCPDNAGIFEFSHAPNSASYPAP